MKLTRTTPKFKGDFSLEISYLNSWPLQSPMWISFFWFKISLFSWQQIEGLCQKQKCCVKKGNVIRDMFRPGSLSGFPIDNTFSLLFVRFVEFSGKNCFHCVAMFHCRIFSITRAVVARYGEVSCDLIHSVLLSVWFIWYFQLSLFLHFNCDWLANNFYFSSSNQP